MMSFETVHPKNGCDVTLTLDEDCKVLSAVYSSDDEEVDLTDSVKSAFQSDADAYVS